MEREQPEKAGFHMTLEGLDVLRILAITLACKQSQRGILIRTLNIEKLKAIRRVCTHLIS